MDFDFRTIDDSGGGLCAANGKRNKGVWLETVLASIRLRQNNNNNRTIHIPGAIASLKLGID